jgi:ABC-2 type transport system permease protein
VSGGGFAPLIGRALRVAAREPWAVFPNLAISVFFLVVYNAGLSGIARLPVFGGTPYLAFVVPVALVSGSVGGAGAAGQALIRDVETGVLAKWRTTPVARLAIVLAPMVAGMAQLVAETVGILGLALLLGLRIPTGVGGALGVVGLAAGWGLGFAGYAVAVALRSRSGRTAQTATFVFFPLIFLSDTFVPLQAIPARWFRVVARLNPTTYVFGAMRTLLSPRPDPGAVAAGVAAIAGLIAVTVTAALLTAQRVLREG